MAEAGDRATAEERFDEIFSEIAGGIMRQNNIAEGDVENELPSLLDDRGRLLDSDFSELPTLCAYIYRFGAHAAGLTRYKVLKASRECQIFQDWLTKYCPRRSDMLVVSLGGGPGNDAEGMSRALYERGFRGPLRIIVTDAIAGWYQSVLRLLSHRREEVTLVFAPMLLPGDPGTDEDFYTDVGNADIILISKLFDVMDDASVTQTIENLFRSMNDRAFILFIGSFKPRFWRNFEVLYSENESYTSHCKNRCGLHTVTVRSNAGGIAVLRKKAKPVVSRPDSEKCETESDESEHLSQSDLLDDSSEPDIIVDTSECDDSSGCSIPAV